MTDNALLFFYIAPFLVLNLNIHKHTSQKLKE